MSIAMARVFASSGANQLDKKVPRWAERVDPSKLIISDCELCVLGQLIGHYVDGLSLLVGKHAAFAARRNYAMSHGFCYSEEATENELNEAWTELIRERKEAAHA